MVLWWQWWAVVSIGVQRQLRNIVTVVCDLVSMVLCTPCLAWCSSAWCSDRLLLAHAGSGESWFHGHTAFYVSCGGNAATLYCLLQSPCFIGLNQNLPMMSPLASVGVLMLALCLCTYGSEYDMVSPGWWSSWAVRTLPCTCSSHAQLSLAPRTAHTSQRLHQCPAFQPGNHHILGITLQQLASISNNRVKYLITSYNLIGIFFIYLSIKQIDWLIGFHKFKVILLWLYHFINCYVK